LKQNGYAVSAWKLSDGYRTFFPFLLDYIQPFMDGMLMGYVEA